MDLHYTNNEVNMYSLTFNSSCFGKQCVYLRDCFRMVVLLFGA